MTTRRAFLSSTVAAGAGARALLGSLPWAWADAPAAGRIASEKRRFHSAAVEETIADVKRSLRDPELARLFENCFPNTLDTTVTYQELEGTPDTFVITGDIPAMWLRDSAAQVWPYLPLARRDPKLKTLLAGVVRRQARCILIDPYANAFNAAATGSDWAKDLTQMKPELHERKWEIDSLCYPIRLAHGYWKQTGDTSCFDTTWQTAMALVVKTFKEQQRLSGPGPYSFMRTTERATDTLPGDGRGNPTRPCGLIHSAFRPSDDACTYPFLIPSNLFAVVSLRQLAEIFESVLSKADFALECRALAAQVEQAVQTHAKAERRGYGTVYAYEVDGFGNQLFMDDSNVPSLLALPYLGCCAPDDPVYKATRALVLSPDNPYFFKGTAGEGVGGPHVGLGWIWPMGVILRALTSQDATEIRACLDTLKGTHAGTGFMHEAFWKDDAAKFTRPWFAWANTLFGELILKLHAERPELVRK
jgi:meiotically up-regulated gene 157 (Mug157) protein